MKGIVFIGWSGDTKIANDIKNTLEDKEHDYRCIVGGETRVDGKAAPQAKTLYLGQLILDEIDKCNQAIFILKKKDDGSISHSALFELGYALSRLKPNKIHVFYIDIPENDDSIPTDLKGIYAKHIDTTPDEQIDDQVVTCFIENQRNIVDTNKMDIINSYYEERHLFDKYEEMPFCSEYELAQHVLIFSQAAYMLNDINEGSNCLTRLANGIKLIPELELAIQYAQCYLSIFKSVNSDENIIFLNKVDFISKKRTLINVLNAIEEWGDNDFKIWFKILVIESLNYIHILCSSCPDVTDSDRESYLKKSIEYANECLKLIELVSDKESDLQFACVYKAYMYRNLFTAKRALNSSDVEVYKDLIRSFKEREKLLEYYKIKSISSRIYENFEMEYYLAISELLDTPPLTSMTNEAASIDYDIEENIFLCKKYLEKAETLHKEKSHFISRIRRNVENAEQRLN